MARSCPVCRHPEAQAINADIIAGVGDTVIHKQHSTSSGVLIPLASFKYHRLAGHAHRTLTAALLAGGPAAELTSIAISAKAERLQDLQDLRDRIISVIEARSIDPELVKFAGGDSGLLVARKRVIGSGPTAESITEASFDGALIDQLRRVLHAAAAEMGQWAPAGLAEKGEGEEPTPTVYISQTIGPGSPGVLMLESGAARPVARVKPPPPEVPATLIRRIEHAVAHDSSQSRESNDGDQTPGAAIIV